MRARVAGLVQGVGFRPFVWREATALGVSGWVGNDAAGVVLEAEGAPAQVDALLDALRRPPPLARVDRVQTEPLAPVGDSGFEVRTSATGGDRLATVPADTATCAACLQELRDPADRRFGHPFTNCTGCGPRFTIVASVPYDRSRTTMAEFAMCAACREEYEDPADRRFHAEPSCCPACGPSLRLVDVSGVELPGEPVRAAADLLRGGAVVAVKGLGGYHLAVDALREDAVAALRGRKSREDRPFAVMVPDLAAAERLCEVDEQERALLTSPARPIVLLRRRRPDADVAPSVAPGSPTLGVMLPYTPLHTLLLEACARPIVLTSGNASDEPIAYEDGDASRRLGGIADALLVHDRQIRTRVDDSVVRVVRGRPVPIRRSRGYVPDPVALPMGSSRPVLAVGAALKSTFCLVRGDHAFLSHHIGDLDDYATYASFREGVAHLSALLDVAPSVVAHDLHPDYPSTRYALELDIESVAVQHHHAHIASCLADNSETGPVIGVAFDGLGLGTDGTAWGGEFLVASLDTSLRAAHLSTVPMPGGDAAAREPWRMAAAHLQAAYGDALPAGLDVAARNAERWEQVLSVARAGVHAPLTSSAGRLFDAVAALLGLRDVVTYEGQAAIALEHAADPAETGSYRVPVHGGVVEVGALVRAVCDDLASGTAIPLLAARFHNGLADVVLDVCGRLRDEHDLSTVALSGGVFQNALLMTRCLDRLEAAGFRVLTHRQVPCNDGGISFGQAAVAAARLQAR